MTLRKMAMTLVCAGLVTGLFGCGPKDDAAPATTPPPTTATAPPPVTPTPAPADAKPGTTVKLPDGLEYTDTKIGTGPEAQPGLHVVVHYTGTLTDGTKFDSSLDHNRPFDFILGGGQVIKGWDEGVKGMKVGGERKLKIPPALGYGEKGAPPRIPGNATLLFTVSLLDVK